MTLTINCLGEAHIEDYLDRLPLFELKSSHNDYLRSRLEIEKYDAVIVRLKEYVKSFYQKNICSPSENCRNNILFLEGNCPDELELMLANRGLKKELFNEILWLDSERIYKMIRATERIIEDEVKTYFITEEREDYWFKVINEYIISLRGDAALFVIHGLAHPTHPNSNFAKIRFLLGDKDLKMHRCNMSVDCFEQEIINLV
ncbi:Uncharacterised protein [Candidatus Tiddalikarchaeum anstoanum]|nr:Uncharacterised protein [Candidatus Tiddalikarchaeum anstoanum]